MKFNIVELDRLILEDLRHEQSEIRLAREIDELIERIDALEEIRQDKMSELRKLKKNPAVMSKAQTYFSEYLQHCQQTMALPEKVNATTKGGLDEDWS